MSPATESPDADDINTLALRALSLEFNAFVDACMDADGNPKAPTRQALMRARGTLPPYCRRALQKQKP